MTKYYIYSQTFASKNIGYHYDAYTDNPYLIRKYNSDIEKYLINSKYYVPPVYYNNITEVESENEEKMIHLVNRMEITSPLSKDNKLWLLNSQNSDNSIVLNDSTYNKFIEKFILTNEAPKMDHDLYRLSRPKTIAYLSKYLRSNVFNEIVGPITMLYNAHKRIKYISGELNQPLITRNRLESELWYIIDECNELDRFIQMDIKRASWISCGHTSSLSLNE